MIEFEKKKDLLLKSDEQAKSLNTVPHVVAAAEGELERLFRSCLKAPVTDGSRSAWIENGREGERRRDQIHTVTLHTD
ncbi:hypothetical protein AgCh_027299 [Apium graveolens]